MQLNLNHWHAMWCNASASSGHEEYLTLQLVWVRHRKQNTLDPSVENDACVCGMNDLCGQSLGCGPNAIMDLGRKGRRRASGGV